MLRVMSEASPPSESERVKISQARAVLATFGFAEQRVTDRSALILLALADLGPDQEWVEAAAPLMRVSEVIEWIKDHYRKDYTTTSRESFRETLQLFLDAGLIALNPDELNRPTNSARTCYGLRDAPLKILQDYPSLRASVDARNFKASNSFEQAFALGRIPWEEFSYQELENLVAALLARTYPDAQQVGQQGRDKGADFIRKEPDGVHAFEVKNFTERLNASQRNALASSLRKAVQSFPDLAAWTLVLPHDPAPSETQWLRDELSTLTAASVNWIGRTWLEAQAAAHPDVLTAAYQHLKIGFAQSAPPSGQPTDADAESPVSSTRTPRHLHVAAVNDAPAATDSLDIGQDVSALASLIVARETAVPLSIAIAGRWGSGKSTFVRQLRTAVDRLITPNAEDTAFIESTCQIEFNAWHYSDDHLWVGIIEALFDGLSARFATASEPAQSPEDVLDRIESLRSQRILLEAAAQVVGDRPSEALSKLRQAARKAGGPRATRRVATALIGAAKDHLWAWTCATSIAVAGGGLLLARHNAYGWIAALVPAVKVAQTLVGSYRRAQAGLQREIAVALTRLDTEFEQLEPVTSLAHFLSQKSSTQPYGLHRGIVGMVHQDLVALHDYLDTAARSGDPRVPSRIILHIDDIERCEPGKIVKILTAINFLQNPAWRFVIVAAVDPQLLVKALDHQYGALFGEVTAEDYLDKIFQISLRLDTPSEHAIANLLSEVLGRKEENQILVAAQHESEGLPISPSHPPVGQPLRQHVNDAAHDSTPVDDHASTHPREPLSERLRLTTAEITYMRTAACLLHTPRAAKRLANTYRLLRLKIAVTQVQLDEFLAGQGPDAAYHIAITLLAIQADDPSTAGNIFRNIQRAENEEQLLEIVRNSHPVEKSRAVASILEDLHAGGKISMELDQYQKWCLSVARYSFHGCPDTRTRRNPPTPDPEVESATLES